MAEDKLEELLFEDKFGPTRIGADYGLSNIVEGAVYSSIATAAGLFGNRAINDLGAMVSGHLFNTGSASYGGFYSSAFFTSAAIPFLGFTFGIAHALGEPGSKEKIATGVGLAGTLAYSIYETLNASYGISTTSYLLQALAGNLALGSSVLLQASIPVLAVFGLGYVLGRVIRRISGRSKRVTKRERK